MVSAAGENVGDLVMSGKEALNVPRRLESLHDPLSSSGRLMGVFGPVIEALVLTMLDPGHDLPLGSGVASQLVGDETIMDAVGVMSPSWDPPVSSRNKRPW